MKATAHYFVVAVCLTAATSIPAGEIHKWVDENGVTVYSQTPPSDTVSTTVAPPPPPPTGAEQSRIQLEEQIERLDRAGEARETAAAEKAAEEKRLAEKRAACERARDQLAALESGPPRKLLIAPDGSTRRLSYDELEEEIAKTRENVKYSCDGL